MTCALNVALIDNVISKFMSRFHVDRAVLNNYWYGQGHSITFLNIIEHQTATGSVSQFCFAMSTKSTLILLTEECTGFCL